MLIASWRNLRIFGCHQWDIVEPLRVEVKKNCLLTPKLLYFLTFQVANVYWMAQKGFSLSSAKFASFPAEINLTMKHYMNNLLFCFAIHNMSFVYLYSIHLLDSYQLNEFSRVDRRASDWSKPPSGWLISWWRFRNFVWLFVRKFVHSPVGLRTLLIKILKGFLGRLWH